MDVEGGIAVLDFGGQYAHLIRRRLREAGIKCELLAYNTPLSQVKKAKGVIISGGPASVYGKGSLKLAFSLGQLDLPVLGICYGHQLIASELGGIVERSRKREYGKAKVRILADSELFRGIPNTFTVWLSHSDAVSSLPKGAFLLCRSEFGDNAAICYQQRKVYSLQFHPEVSHTEYGKVILENFAKRICNCSSDYVANDFVSSALKDIREKIGNSKAICAVSGGLDSTTAAVLVRKAIGSRLKCVFVDHGLMRKNEPEQVIEILRDKLQLDVDYIKASNRFLKALKGVKDPEEKRLVVGRLFASIFEEYVSREKGYEWLVQGTLYPDVIESSMPVPGSPRIKAHHNVAGLPDSIRKRLKVLEPLRDLYKDEVRIIARQLKIPDEIVSRHPFPGPGLAVRIIGEVTKEKLRICRESSWMFEDELKKAKIYEKLWQAFAFVGDDKAVGVAGDKRRYGFIVTLRAVTSEDGMTASYYPIPWQLLDRVSRKITNLLPRVTMVSYSISNKPPSTIEPQ